MIGQINAPRSWPYCLDLLPQIYSRTSNNNIQSDSVDIWSIARTQLNTTLPKPMGYGMSNSLLPAWNNNAQYTMAQIQGLLSRSG